MQKFTCYGCGADLTNAPGATEYKKKQFCSDDCKEDHRGRPKEKVLRKKHTRPGTGNKNYIDGGE